MSDKEEFYEVISKSIIGVDNSKLADLVGDNYVHRIEAHRGNYRMSTQSTIISAYPIVARLVGDEYISGLAQKFVEEFPPKVATLPQYGDEFPEFLRKFAPVQKDLPWLSAVAELDRAWFFAYSAKDQVPLRVKDLQGKAALALPILAPCLVASASLLRFTVPAYSIWRTNKQDDEVKPVNLRKGAQWAVVWRKDNQINHQSLTQAEYVFLTNIEGGLSFANSYAEAVKYDKQFDLQRQFSHWLSAGLFKGDEKCAN